MTLLAATLRALTMPQQRPVPVLAARYNGRGNVVMVFAKNASERPRTTRGRFRSVHRQSVLGPLR